MSEIANPYSFKSVCVYCGSSGQACDDAMQAARDVGAAFGSRRVRIVYGGGRAGLMGCLADASLAAGGEVIGIIPNFIRAREIQHNGLTQLRVVDNMHARKRMMTDLADAFVILPGGVGTVDETFEALAWKHLGLHNKPIVFYNINGFWLPLFDLIHHMVKLGFLPAKNEGLYKIAGSVDEMLRLLAQPLGPVSDPAEKWL